MSSCSLLNDLKYVNATTLVSVYLFMRRKADSAGASAFPKIRDDFPDLHQIDVSSGIMHSPIISHNWDGNYRSHDQAATFPEIRLSSKGKILP